MKSLILRSLLLTSFVCLVICLVTFGGCDLKNPHDDAAKPNFLKKQTTLNKSGGSGNCNCVSGYINPNCNNCVGNDFMHGGDQVVYHVSWSGCTSHTVLNCAPNGVFSTLTFCYASPSPGTNECNLLMQIDTVPNCISCLTPSFPYCLQMKASCTKAPNGKDYELTCDYKDPISGDDISLKTTITISQDPAVTICCTDAQGNQSCCSGTMY